MSIVFPALTMAQSLWSPGSLAADRVRVEWPSILSRDREGLSTWLATRKAESDRKLMERVESLTIGNSWLAREDSIPAMDRVPLPFTEEIQTLPIQTQKEILPDAADTLDDVKMGLLRAWRGEEENDGDDEKLSADKVKHEDSNIKEDKADIPAVTTVEDLMVSLWSAWEGNDKKDTDTIVEIVGPNLAEELKESMMSAWDGTEEDLEAEKEDTEVPDKEGVTAVSIVEDLRRFLYSIAQDEEEDQHWITVDEAMDDTASIVTLEDIEDITELPDSFSDLSQWLCRFI